MATYILQPKNYTGLNYFASHTSQQNFVLSIHNTVHYQKSEQIQIYIDLEKYIAIFYNPVYFKQEEYISQYARSPPLVYQEVQHGYRN